MSGSAGSGASGQATAEEAKAAPAAEESVTGSGAGGPVEAVEGEARAAELPVVEVDITSDVMCPWCIGKPTRRCQVEMIALTLFGQWVPGT